MNFKRSLIIFLLLPLFSFGQTCDTLYSQERYIQRNVDIEYRNCHFLKIDTVYTVVEWENIDTNYLTPNYIENICYSLFHSLTGKLIRERWEDSDTIYVKSYYSSGELKSFSKDINRKEPYFFQSIIKEYYENGNLRHEGEYKSFSFSIHKTYYPDGALETIAKRFSYNPHAFGEYTEYFPNGQVSMIENFTEPDTTTNQYQLSTLLSTHYFDKSGKVVEQNQNEYRKMYIKIYPPDEGTTMEMVGDDLYLFELFSEQEAYANDMSALKSEIYANLKLSKTECCTKGIAWISLIVTKKGKLKIKEIVFENAEVRKRIEKSIHKIKRWTPAQVTDKNVDTYVLIYLILDE